MNLTLTCDTGLLEQAIPGWNGLGSARGARSQAILSALERAVALDLKPAETPVNGHARYKATLYLPDGMAAQLVALTERYRLSEPAVVRGLLAAMGTAGQSGLESTPIPVNHPIAKLNAALRALGEKAEDRPEQVAIYDYLCDSLVNRAIGMVEAGTGVGKTRAEIAAACTWVKDSGNSLCIAVPTLVLIRQAIVEYGNQKRVHRHLPPLRAIRGRREFISQEAVDLALNDEVLDIDAGDRKSAEDWLRRGQGKTHEFFPWSADSLERAAPSLPIDELRLNEFTDKTDAGYRAYKAQFSRSDDDAPEILLCTHAMLAQDALMRMRAIGRDESFQTIQQEIFSALKQLTAASKAGEDKPELVDAVQELKAGRGRLAHDLSLDDIGLLPPYAALIVDEAHLLEETFANALSDYVSLRALIWAMHAYRNAGGGLPASVITEADKTVRRLTEIGHAGQFLSLARGDGYGAVHAQLARLRADIKTAFGNPRAADKKRKRYAVEITRALAVIGAALKNGRGYIHFSSTRSYPQVYVGPYSVESTLQTLWNQVTAGACISATLYTERSDGYSSTYQRVLLGIDASQAREYRPLHVRWTLDPVRVYTPDPANPEWLLPPSIKDEEDVTERWLDEVALMLRNIHQTSAGGCLALMTSYAAAEGIAERLMDISQCLVVARDTVSARQQHLAYCRLLGKEGIKPLWLGLRVAWTGIDVGGHTDEWLSVTGNLLPADKDNVLTDLVIPRLPYMLNQSLTFRWRVKNRPHFPWATLDAAFLFKQGLGRLIRRPGLPNNRRIFALDARLVKPDGEAQRALFWNTLQRYHNRSALKLDTN